MKNMLKFVIRFLIVLFIVSIASIAYLSYFGIETNKFDNLIKNKTNSITQYAGLDFENTKIHLNIKELNLAVKLKNPKILVKKNKINLSRLNFYLSLKSFFSSAFLLERAEISFIQNDIRDITKITNIFLPRIINKKLKKIFAKGKITGEFILPFDNDGKIKDSYEFSGKILDAQIKPTKEFLIENTTIEIRHGGELKNAFQLDFKGGQLFDLDLKGTRININKTKISTKIKSILHTSGKLEFSQIKKLASLFNLKIENFKDLHGKINAKTKIDFDISKNLRLKNINYGSQGNIDYLEILTKGNRSIKNYLPDYSSKILLKDTEFKFNDFKDKKSIRAQGLVNFGNDFNKFEIIEIIDAKKNTININGDIDLTNSKINVDKINYKKDNKIKSSLSFDVDFLKDKNYYIKNLSFLANKSKIKVDKLKLNNNFEVINLENIEIVTYSNNKKNNDFLIKKSKKIIISGNIFDAQPLLKSLYKENDKKIFSKSFKSEMEVNIEEALTGSNDDIFDFSMVAFINNGSYEKLSLKGNFSQEEIVEMSIYQINENKKSLQVISDRARPFLKNFEFIKGFEGGKLEYESIIEKKISHSNLKLIDFKVSKVPSLAKLLTLASLRGIADTLSGEGIHFDSFEMKSNSEGNLLNIEEALAFGPAVSILLDGYVDKGKVVSLKGTLVPATKLNSIIASIPIVGDILVGKKAGEGVVGVSFKMKGPPKNIKTTVNPIKTLTPRFILRAIEKMKKGKKKTK